MNSCVAGFNQRVLWSDVQQPPPLLEWVCLNSDVDVKMELSIAGYGLIHYHLGCLLGGYSKSIGICNVMVVELWSVLKGLKFCQAKRWRNVMVQVDAEVACQVIQDSKCGCISS